MKIGILGDNKSVLAFGALGVEVFGVEKEGDLMNILEKINKDKFAILLITEDIAQKYEQAVKSLFQGTLPACLVIPGIKKGSGKAKEELKKILERALGSESVLGGTE